MKRAGSHDGVGRDVNFKVDKKDRGGGEVVLHVENLHAKDYRGVEILKGFHLDVRKGETEDGRCRRKRTEQYVTERKAPT